MHVVDARGLHSLEMNPTACVHKQPDGAYLQL